MAVISHYRYFHEIAKYVKIAQTQVEVSGKKSCKKKQQRGLK